MARLYNMVEMARMSFVLLLFAASLAAQAPGRNAGSFPVDSITVEGNKILGSAAIIQVSGLKRGEKGDSAAFDAARDRLLASG